MIIPVPRRFVSRDSADRFIGVTRESSIRQRDVPGMAADMPLAGPQCHGHPTLGLSVHGRDGRC